jgi:hypothetical protein
MLTWKMIQRHRKKRKQNLELDVAVCRAVVDAVLVVGEGWGAVVALAEAEVQAVVDTDEEDDNLLSGRLK